jgi:hypothetical protein
MSSRWLNVSRTNSWWGAMRLIRLLRVVTDISETTVSEKGIKANFNQPSHMYRT